MNNLLKNMGEENCKSKQNIKEIIFIENLFNDISVKKYFYHT